MRWLRRRDDETGLLEDLESGRREWLAAGYLIGADGTNSRVRSALGIDFKGFTYAEKFFSITTPFDYAARMPGISPVTYFADPEEWCLMLKAPDFWRVMFPIPAGESDEETQSDDKVEARLQGHLPQDEAYPVVHRTLYRVQQRVAERYLAGRVLLAGDAAHNNNPLGGMGLNSGLHDAMNLAEKLIRVRRGEGGSELLEQYSRQRRWVSLEHVNQMAARNKNLLEERDPETRRRHLDEMRRIAEDPERAYEFVLNSSLIASLRRAAEL